MSGSTGAYIVQPGEIILNAQRHTIEITVKNTGDRAIQVGSHYHFFEANPALEFPREEAWGKHLAIPSGLAIRFEPGDQRTVELVDFGGKRILRGFAGLVNGSLDDDSVKNQAFAHLESFLHANEETNNHTKEQHAHTDGEK